MKKSIVALGIVLALSGCASAADETLAAEPAALVEISPATEENAQPVEAAATAVILMGVAGEVGFANMESTDGNSTYRNRIIDAIYNMDADKLCSMAKYEIR